MDEDQGNAFEIFCSNIQSWPEKGKDLDEQLESFNESYHGYFGGVMKVATEEFAYQYIEDTGLLSNVPETLERYFDYGVLQRICFYMATPNTTVMYLLITKKRKGLVPNGAIPFQYQLSLKAILVLYDL